MNLVFFKFNESLLALNHIDNLFSSAFSILVRQSFRMVECKSYHTALTYKWYPFFLQKSSKRVQRSNEFMFHSHMRFYVTQWSATTFNGSLSVYSHPLPSEKIAPFGLVSVYVPVYISELTMRT